MKKINTFFNSVKLLLSCVKRVNYTLAQNVNEVYVCKNHLKYYAQNLMKTVTANLFLRSQGSILGLVCASHYS